MSLIQSIIGSAVQVTPALTYPTPGSNYPSGSQVLSSSTSSDAPAYYEWPQFISTNPINGLWRKTYEGMALDGSGNLDTNFPGSYTQVRSEIDTAVGFGYAADSATSYTMQWLGYFVPEQDGDFVFGVNSVDDYLTMWIGAPAVSGFNASNNLFTGNGGSSNSFKVPMISGRYYPVRIIYTEGSGGNECSIISGLNGATATNNNISERAGYFKTDDRTNVGAFPNTGLIT